MQYETPLGQLGESKPRTDSLFEADTVSLFSLDWAVRHKGSPTLQGVSPFPVVETPIPASQYNLVLNPPENSCVDINNNENLPPTPFCKHTHSIAMLYHHHLIPPFNRLFFEKIEGMFFLL